MNNKKLYTIPIWMMLTGIMLLGSCRKDETVSKPEISQFELGLENSQTGYVGAGLHIEAEIVATGTISTVFVEIHPEGEEKSTRELLFAWELDTTYTTFDGLKNTLFHEHVSIPAEADTGMYHFHFVVTDKKGYQTTIERDLHVTLPNDEEAPVIAVSDFPAATSIFTTGQTIAVTALLTDNIGLGGAYVGLVRSDQNLTDEEMNYQNTITLVHTHDFADPDEYALQAEIVVGASQDYNHPPKDITGDLAWQSGEYYLLIKAVDKYGGHAAFSQRFYFSIEY